MSNDTRSSYPQEIGEAYERKAWENGWLNKDGTVFPISVKNLSNFIRMKSETAGLKTINNWLGALNTYQMRDLTIEENWESVRNHEKIKKLKRGLFCGEKSQKRVRRSSKDKYHAEGEQDEEFDDGTTGEGMSKIYAL